MIPAASTDTSVTSASPIISADAVDAVRCGFRRELSRARKPATPPIFVAGQPSAPASGGTRRIESSATPKKTSSAPPSMKRSTCVVPRSGANRPTSRPANPSSVSRIDAGRRKRTKRPSGRVAPSRTAAIGGTRVARIAGRRLASTVTTMPTISATTIVRVSKVRPLFGSVKPTASKSLNSPFASARPRKSPTTEASVPITRASMTIVRST